MRVSADCISPIQLVWLGSNLLKFVLMQFTARLNAEKIKAFVHLLNEGKIPKKQFNCKWFNYFHLRQSIYWPSLVSETMV